MIGRFSEDEGKTSSSVYFVVLEGNGWRIF